MEIKKYDLVAIGTGSAMLVVDGFLRFKPDAKIAVIDKDEPGGICLTRGCIPSKLIIYPAELLAEIKKADEFGIDVDIKGINFKRIMERMRKIIEEDIKMIEEGLKASKVDYYRDVATFIEPYTLKVGNNIIRGETIVIGSGSKPLIPNIPGLKEAGYLTSDDVLKLDEIPESLAIIGGGYIAMEYGNLFARLGCDVKIIEMADRLLPNEEIEISKAVEREMREIAEIYTSHRVVEVRSGNPKVVIAEKDGNKKEIEADEILVAVGRAPNSDILKPEMGGIETSNGWIKVNEYLQTTIPRVYALGDAIGKHMFKHVANYEARVVLSNILGMRIAINYKAVPHAVFTQPEVASVGMKEREAINKFGKDNVLIGFARMDETGRGLAMKANGFVKLIVKKDGEILGCHIVGKDASILIQEVVLAMQNDIKVSGIINSMHIHPALSEVILWASSNLMSVDDYAKLSKNFI